MIGLAAPAYADPEEISGDDAGFLSALRQAGIDSDGPAQAIRSAKAVCTCLNNGETGLELVHDVKAHNPGMDMEVASNFAMIASKFYCPQHLSQA
jgi:Protein of unknown function (DUF732)